MKSTMMLIACVAITFGAINTAQGTVLMYEGFDYAAGNLHNKGSWESSGGNVKVHTSGLSYTNLVVSGRSAGNSSTSNASLQTGAHMGKASIGEIFENAGTDDTLYFSYLFGTENAGGTGERANWALTPNHALVPDDGIYVGINPGGLVYPSLHDLASGESGPAPLGTAADTRLIVGRVTFSAGTGAETIKWVLNPDILTLTDGVLDTVTNATFNGGVSSGDLTTAGIDAISIVVTRAEHKSLIDELRVATTLAEVIPIVPEPASLALLGLGGLMMLNRRRRMS